MSGTQQHTRALDGQPHVDVHGTRPDHAAGTTGRPAGRRDLGGASDIPSIPCSSATARTRTSSRWCGTSRKPTGSPTNGPALSSTGSTRRRAAPPTITVFPTLGLEGSLHVGQRRVLRVPNARRSGTVCTDNSSPSNSQSIDCEPRDGRPGPRLRDVRQRAAAPWYPPTSSRTRTGGRARRSRRPATRRRDSSACRTRHGERVAVRRQGARLQPERHRRRHRGAIGNCRGREHQERNSCNPQTFNCTNPNYYDPPIPTSGR